MGKAVVFLISCFFLMCLIAASKVKEAPPVVQKPQIFKAPIPVEAPPSPKVQQPTNHQNQLTFCYMRKGVISLHGCRGNENTRECAVSACGEYDSYAYTKAVYCLTDGKFISGCAFN